MIREIKQVILIREDLEVQNLGKLVTQGVHAALDVFFKKVKSSKIELSDIDIQWYKEGYTKIVKSVKNESQLLKVYNKAKDKGLPCSLIQDAGYTEFEEPTYTAVAIGPELFEEINKITKRFRLL